MCDRDPMGSSRLDAGLESGTNVVDMYVHVPKILTPDDQDRVADGIQPLTESGHGGLGAVREQIHDLVCRPAPLRLDVVTPTVPSRSGASRRTGCNGRGEHPVLPSRVGRPLAGDDTLEGLQHQHVAHPSGINHTGASQAWQLGGGVGQRHSCRSQRGLRDGIHACSPACPTCPFWRSPLTRLLFTGSPWLVRSLCRCALSACLGGLDLSMAIRCAWNKRQHPIELRRNPWLPTATSAARDRASVTASRTHTVAPSVAGTPTSSASRLWSVLPV